MARRESQNRPVMRTPEAEPRPGAQATIFCEDGSNLALAELDGSMLCAQCLLDVVASSDDSADTASRIRPLAEI